MTEVTSGVLVKMKHIRSANLCAGGMKDWFAENKIDYRGLRDGIPAEVLEATGDPYALRVVEIARADHGR